MKWRNEQIYHLRQNKPLSLKDQNNYFNNIVEPLFSNLMPNQILFSYLKGTDCIGYGGLVHINWIDKNAEISFIISTVLEQNEFQKHWKIFLSLIYEVAFIEMKLNKIFTYAIDVRPKLYPILESNGFVKEAVLKKHSIINNEYFDVVIHSRWSD